MNRFGMGLATLALAFCGTLSAWAANEGQADLDKATEQKLSARTFGDLQTIIDLCESAIKKGLDKDQTDFAQKLLGSTLLQRGLKLGENVIEQSPPDPRWPQMREFAVRDLEKFLTIEPKSTDALSLIAKLEVYPGGSSAKGMKAVETLLEIHKDDKVEFARALVLRAALREKPDESLKDLQDAIAKNEACIEAFRSRGRLYLLQKKHNEAAVDFSRALALKADDSSSLEGMVEVLAIQEKFDKAIEFADRLVKALPSNAQTLVMRARLHMNRRDSQKAISDLNDAVAKDSGNYLALVTRANVRLSQNELEMARDDAERAFQAAKRLPVPTQIQAILLRANVAAAMHNYDAAIGDVQRVIEIDSGNIDLRLQLAALHASNGRLSTALAIVNKLIDAAPKDGRLLRHRGDIYLNSGKQKLAIADYRAALQLDPNDEGAMNNLAWVLCTSPDETLRNGAEAVKIASKAVELSKEKRAHIVSTLAAAYAETKDFDSAVKWSEKAMALSGEELRNQLTAELENFKAKKPIRELKTIEQKPEAASPNPNDLDFK